MSFLYKRLVTYLDAKTSDPEAEAKQRKNERELKSLKKRANSFIDDEKTLIKKAQNTQSQALPEEALRYSIFPDDAKELFAFLDKVTNDINNLQNVEDINDYITDNFNLDYENYKINAINNTSIYPRSKGGRFGYWLLISALKQLAFDNKLSLTELYIVNNINSDLQKILVESKYESLNDWKPLTQDDLKNKDNYDFLASLPSSTDEKTSATIKSLIPKLFISTQTLLKNRGELKFQSTSLDKIQTEKTQTDEKDQDKFELKSLLYDTLTTIINVMLQLLTIFILILGASFAVNLNVHKPLAYKIFYMIYGLIFGFIVIPYVLIYRWWFLGKKPVYYGFMPLIPRFFINPKVQFLLGWLTYKPDETISDLEEWKHYKPLF
jgi:hypothetical protein